MTQITHALRTIRDFLLTYPNAVRALLGLLISLGILTIAEAQADAVSAAIVALAVALGAGAKPVKDAAVEAIEAHKGHTEDEPCDCGEEGRGTVALLDPDSLTDDELEAIAAGLDIEEWDEEENDEGDEEEVLSHDGDVAL